MLRPAIEQTIAEFERREGVKVTRVYNGCGILVAQMKAGEVPDAYFACDSEFMNQVNDIVSQCRRPFHKTNCDPGQEGKSAGISVVARI